MGAKGAVPDQQRLGRYQAFHKLEMLLSSGKIRFGSLASYVNMDPREGALPEWAYRHRLWDRFSDLPAEMQERLRQESVHLPPARRALGDEYLLTKLKHRAEENIAHIRKMMAHTFINCWTIADAESWMMWNSYARLDAKKDSLNRGVCIITSPSRIRDSLSVHRETFWLGYVDYLRNDDVVEAQAQYVVTGKRLEFRHEEEVRLAFLDDPCFDPFPVVPFPDEDVIPDADNIVPQTVGDTCRFFDVNYKILIEEILVHPEASVEDVAMVKGLANKYDIDVPINKSSLLEPGVVPPVRHPKGRGRDMSGYYADLIGYAKTAPRDNRQT